VSTNDPLKFGWKNTRKYQVSLFPKPKYHL
jgi:hypothetical protein